MMDQIIFSVQIEKDPDLRMEQYKSLERGSCIDRLGRAERLSTARKNAMAAILNQARKDSLSDEDIAGISRERRNITTIKAKKQNDLEMFAHRSSKILSKEDTELNELRRQLELREIELKEAKYEIKCLTEQEVERQRVDKRNFDVREKELLHCLEHTRKAVEGDRIRSEEKSRAAVAECERLLRFILAMEKHTMYGRHAVASQTVVGLLMKTRQGLEGLRGIFSLGPQVVAHRTDDNVNSADTFMYNDQPTTDLGNPEEPSGTVVGPLSSSLGTASKPYLMEKSILKSWRESGVESALLEICRHLEVENMRLEKSLRELRKDVEDGAKEADVGKLIPHYRLAIVRARSQIIFLQKQVEREQATSDGLRKELEHAYKCLQDLLDEENYQEELLREKLRGDVGKVEERKPGKSGDEKKRGDKNIEGDRRKREREREIYIDRKSGGTGRSSTEVRSKDDYRTTSLRDKDSRRRDKEERYHSVDARHQRRNGNDEERNLQTHGRRASAHQLPSSQIGSYSCPRYDDGSCRSSLGDNTTISTLSRQTKPDDDEDEDYSPSRQQEHHTSSHLRGRYKEPHQRHHEHDEGVHLARRVPSSHEPQTTDKTPAFADQNIHTSHSSHPFAAIPEKSRSHQNIHAVDTRSTDAQWPRQHTTSSLNRPKSAPSISELVVPSSSSHPSKQAAPHYQQQHFQQPRTGLYEPEQRVPHSSAYQTLPMTGPIPTSSRHHANHLGYPSFVGLAQPVDAKQVQHVERELTALDLEIGALRGMLEEAALKHTQSIVADVMDRGSTVADSHHHLLATAVDASTGPVRRTTQ